MINLEAKDTLVTRYVKTGEIVFRDGHYPFKPLRATLGSCIGLALYDPVTKLSGFAHMMVPNHPSTKNPGKLKSKGKYVDIAIPHVLDWFNIKEIPFFRLEAKMAGGSSLLSKKKGFLRNELLGGPKNVQTAIKILLKHGINLIGQDTGGDTERVMYFFPSDGNVLIREPSTGKCHMI
ncbi:MAG: chemotaxis protein CheD [Candidatus Odinarchaeota archaeon]